MGGRGGRCQKTEQQQRADCLRRLCRNDPEEREEADAEQPGGDAPCGRDIGRDGHEQQRARDREQHREDGEREDRREACFARAEPEDRAEERSRGKYPAARAGSHPVPRQKEDPEPEDEREDDPDRGVVGGQRDGGPAGAPCDGAGAEETDSCPHRDGRHEQAHTLVYPRRGGRERPGDRDMAERVAGEDLSAQDDEPAADSARERDGRPGDAARCA